MPDTILSSKSLVLLAAECRAIVSYYGLLKNSMGKEKLLEWFTQM